MVRDEIELRIRYILRIEGSLRSEELIKKVIREADCSRNAVIRALKRLNRDEFIFREPPNWNNHECVLYSDCMEWINMVKKRHEILDIPFRKTLYMPPYEKSGLDVFYSICINQEPIPVEITERYLKNKSL